MNNVVTDDELAQLDQIDQENNTPLIVNNAYGNLFLEVIYTKAALSWNKNTILCMSLSKLGLPGIRTGIVIANKDTINAMSRVSGILTLAPSSVGPTLVTELVKSQEIMHIANDIVKLKLKLLKKFFTKYLAILTSNCKNLKWCFFMWIQFLDLKITL
jgi:valine--pyruvate aminotransferase